CPTRRSSDLNIAKKRGNIIRCRIAVNLFRTAGIDHLSIFHDNHQIGKRQNIIAVVRRRDASNLVLFQITVNLPPKRIAAKNVNLTKRLVKQKQLGNRSQCLGQRNPLLLSTTEVLHMNIRKVAHLYDFQKFLYPFALFLLIYIRQKLPDILRRRNKRHQSEILSQILKSFHPGHQIEFRDRKSTRLNSSHVKISYAVFCLKKKKEQKIVRLDKLSGLS